MAWRNNILSLVSILLILLFNACAQTQTLTGGEDDIAAPKPDSLGISPQNESLNFSSKTITFKFNEFIKLNNPVESIRIIPNDTRIKATSKLKTLTLELLDSLKENTTYSIYLNSTVQDLTEQNDSLMTYVFSTGNQIDTNTITIQIKDDFTKQNLENIVVGLYEKNVDPKKTEARFFAKTKSDGKIELKYLREGDYNLFAFEDKNKNYLIDNNEKSGYYVQSIQIPSKISNYKMGLFVPSKSDTTIQFSAPGSIKIGGKNIGLNKNQWTSDVNEKVNFINKDSVVVFFKNNIRFEDSVSIRPNKSIRWTEKDRTEFITGNLQKNEIYPKDSLIIHFNDAIEKYSFSGLYNDTIPFVVKTKLQGLSSILVYDFPLKAKKIEIKANPKEIIGLNTSNKDTLKFGAKMFTVNELGIILLNYNSSKVAQSNIIVEILEGSNSVKSFYFTKGENLVLNRIKPGSYTLRVIEDLDKNKKWTNGNFDNKIASEEVNYYLTPVKVRVGWEIEVSF
jgi:uncharacterized protein (DUF2141 family)